MRKILNVLMGIAGVTALFVSCVKDEYDGDKLGSESKNFVKILEGAEAPHFLSPFTNVQKVDLFTVRRDVNSNASLNQSAVVTLDYDAAAITAYNTANGTAYEPLPASIYTLPTNPGVKVTTTGLEITYSGGDFSKEFSINLDGGKFDLSKTYAMAYKIKNTGGLTLSGTDKVFVIISIKNKYDGTYVVSGTMTDFTNATLSHINNYLSSAGEPPMEFELRTASATKCIVYDNYFFGGNYVPITSAATYSQYGSFALVIEFDPATDKVSAMTNFYGQPASNTRSAQLDPTGVNQYDAATKTIKLKYRMLQPSVVVAAPNIRVLWDEVWKYKGPR